ncbi:MAG TPA: hypothetical protein VF097_04535 [Actinomycetota bacterium]
MSSRENGQPRWRPAIPTVLVVASIVVALVAVSALLYVLFRETVGPGEVLRDFAEALSEDDCPGSYDLLDGSVRASITEEEWCDEVPGLAAKLSPRFEIERVILSGGDARVEVSGPETTTGAWFLRRQGRSWTVLGGGDAIEFPTELPT